MLVPGDSISQVSDSMSIVKCHISGIMYHVSSDNMSNNGVRYQVPSIRCQMITCQVLVSDIKCQGSGVKYNMSSTGVRYQVPSIRCQVITCQVSVQISSVKYQVSSNNMSVSGN